MHLTSMKKVLSPNWSSLIQNQSNFLLSSYKFIYSVKPIEFWEIFTLLLTVCTVRFRKILWPFQKIWNLVPKNWLCIMVEFSIPPSVFNFCKPLVGPFLNWKPASSACNMVSLGRNLPLKVKSSVRPSAFCFHLSAFGRYK